MARTAAKDLPQMPESTGMNTAAVAATLAQLPTDDPRWSALSALALTLAAQLDAGAGMATAAVSKELRATLDALTPEDVPDDAFARFAADLST